MYKNIALPHPVSLVFYGTKTLPPPNPRNIINEEGNGNPLQYSCLGNLMDRGVWWVTVPGVVKTQTQLSDLTRRKYWKTKSQAKATLENKKHARKGK